MGHRLVNHAHNNPFIVLVEIFNHIESYENLILMMAETFRYVTVLSLDNIGSRVSQIDFPPKNWGCFITHGLGSCGGRRHTLGWWRSSYGGQSKGCAPSLCLMMW